jgi:phage terminase large subunit
MTREIDADFPVKLQFLFRPHRYKIARGGRWSGKSWGFARALLIIGAKRPIRVLCTREVQRSIKDSVHKLLCDQIELLGLQSKYRITDTAITGTEGTEILFSGLLQHTIQSIKSFEG